VWYNKAHKDLKGDVLMLDTTMWAIIGYIVGAVAVYWWFYRPLYTRYKILKIKDRGKRSK